MNAIRVAVVGAGHLGRIHTRILASLEPFQLIGVIDPVEAARQSLAAAHQTRACATLDELIHEVDALVIAAPTPLHHQLGLAALRQGKHVLIEKPLAPSRRECQELVEAARRQQRILQVGHVERFNPAFIAARPSLREPKYIEATRRGPFSGRSTDVGVVLDLMIHDLDLVLAMCGTGLRSVDALGVAVLGEHEDVAQVRLSFDNGCIANLSACRVSPTAQRAMQVWTAHGWAALDFQAKTAAVIHPSQAILQRELDVNGLSTDEKALLKQQLMTEHLPLQTLETAAGDAITAELLDFAEAVRTGRAPQVGGEQGRDVVALAEEILSRIAIHRWDARPDGPIGPRALPAPTILRGPHWQTSATKPGPRRQAG